MSYADFDDDFQQADVPEHAEEAPCGTYQCEIMRFFDNTTKDGTSRLNCILQVVSGPHDGKVLYKSWLITKDGMSYIKADFQRFGLPVETTRFSDLRRMLDTDVVGKWCEAVKKENSNNPQYANTYINTMIDQVGKSPGPPSSQVPSLDEAKAVATESGDNIPF